MLAVRSIIRSSNHALRTTALLAAHHRSLRNMSSPAPGPVEQSIRQKLLGLLDPQELNITNDSWQHRHHAPMRAQGGSTGETHFTINVVSEVFEGKTTMQRHRMIYAALSDELAQGLHALSLKTKTPVEMQKATSP